MRVAVPKCAGAETTFDYWKSLPKTGLVPDRSSFDVLQIARAMPDLMMVEYISDREAHFRYAGTRVTDCLGFDPTKRSYLELLAPDAFDQYLEATRAVLTTPCAAKFNVIAQAATGYVMKFEVMDFPLLNKAADTAIILAHVSMVETVDYTGDMNFRIREIVPLSWYDIGAGVPIMV